MPTIDPCDAAADALLAHIRTRVDAALVSALGAPDEGVTRVAYVRGWAAARRSTAPCIIAVVAGEPAIERYSLADAAPAVLTSTTYTTTVGVHGWECDAEVLLLCDHRDVRDEMTEHLAAALDVAAGGTGLEPPVLTLTSTGYHNLPVSAVLTGGPTMTNEEDAAALGEHRATFTVELSGDRVRKRTLVRARSAAVDLTTNTSTTAEL